jgi:NADPH:quinone reductase-like Zn-dependent oxidoreductase
MSLPNTQKALVSNGDKTASIKEIPLVTDLQPHEILIRVRSVGLNPTDWKSLDWPSPPGVVVGCDGAGDVVKVGSAVKHIQVGDRVSGFAFGTSREDNGAFAEYLRLDTVITFKFPETVSYDEAASFPIPHGTAALALYTRLNLPRPSKPANKQDIILIWGGSTAVGHNAVQLAALSGLRVFVTASPSAHDELKQLGAEQVFDYHDPDVISKIKEAAGETGVKYGFDTVATGETGVSVVDAIGPQGGRVISLLPQEKAEKRRSDVRFDMILLYSILAAHDGYGQPYMPQDRPSIQEYLEHEFPALVQDWKPGQGSSKFVPQKLRVLGSGLDKVNEGLDILRKGEYGREKLVCPMA